MGYDREKKRLAGLAVCSTIFCLMSGMVSLAAGGWEQQNGDWYYMSQDGSPVSNQMKMIGSQKYVFDQNGVMLHDTWHYDTSEDKWYYLGSDGAMVKGWLQLGDDWYYMMQSGVMASDGWRNVDGKRYFFLENGVMKRNGYAGEKYLDSNGVNDSRYDIKVRGRAEQETLAEAGDKTAQIPGWLLDHIFKSGWKIALNAEKEDNGRISHEDYDDYILYYTLEKGRKLIFFTNPDYIIQGIGMYVNDTFGRPGNTEDFQGAFSVEWNEVSDMFDQLPIVERNKDVTFAEVFALYYSDDDDTRQEFKEYCPSLYEYMERFMEECRVKSLS